MTLTETPTHCYNHPGVETGLRCNKCDRPICVKCAVRTPTGYRCRECVRSHQKTFETATNRDFLVVFFLGGFLSFLGSIVTILITSVVWGFFVLLVAPTAGVLIGNILRGIIRGHHSRKLNWTLAAGMVVGGLPLVLFSLMPGLFLLLMGGSPDVLTSFSHFGSVIWQIVYLAMATPSAYAQFAGIRLGR